MKRIVALMLLLLYLPAMAAADEEFAIDARASRAD